MLQGSAEDSTPGPQGAEPSWDRGCVSCGSVSVYHLGVHWPGEMSWKTLQLPAGVCVSKPGMNLYMFACLNMCICLCFIS